MWATCSLYLETNQAFTIKKAVKLVWGTLTKEANSAVRQVLEERTTNTTVTATGRKRKYTKQRAKIVCVRAMWQHGSYKALQSRISYTRRSSTKKERHRRKKRGRLLTIKLSSMWDLLEELGYRSMLVLLWLLQKGLLKPLFGGHINLTHIHFWIE